MDISSLYTSCFLCFLLLLIPCSPGSAFCSFHHPMLPSTTIPSTIIYSHMISKSIILNKNSWLHSASMSNSLWAIFTELSLSTSLCSIEDFRWSQGMHFDEEFKNQRENVGNKLTKSEVAHVICIGITVQVVLSFYIRNMITARFTTSMYPREAHSFFSLDPKSNFIKGS